MLHAHCDDTTFRRSRVWLQKERTISRSFTRRRAKAESTCCGTWRNWPLDKMREARRRSLSESGVPMRRLRATRTSASAERWAAGCVSGASVRHEQKTQRIRSYGGGASLRIRDAAIEERLAPSHWAHHSTSAFKS